MNRTFVATAVGLILAATGLAGGAAAQDLARGREIFGLCSQCHGPEGHGNQLFEAPAIAGLPLWYVERQLTKFKQGYRGLHPQDVAGMRMAPMARTLMTDEDLQAVASYVSSLPPERPTPVLTGGDPERGKGYFAICTTCHHEGATGDEKIGSPPLNHASDWYLVAQLVKFRAGIRGTNPGDVHGAVMRPMSLTLPDDQAVKDVIAYIITLPQ